MKNISILLAIILTCISCESKSQEKIQNTANKNTEMIRSEIPHKKFDIQDFKRKIEADEQYYGYTTDKGVEIRQLAVMDDIHLSQRFNEKFVVYYVQEEIGTDNFSIRYFFDKEGKLTENKNFFSDVETGIWKTYSKDGKVLTEVDKDQHYPFSINEVVAFSKKHKGDLSKNGSIERSYDEKLKKYVYEIQWIVDESARSYTQAYILDGSDGKIIKEFEKPVPWIGR